MTSPIRPLAWLLRKVSSREAADAAIGDVIEDLGERCASGLGPGRPALWVNLQTVRAIGLEVRAGAPRCLRSAVRTMRDAVRALRAAPAHSFVVVLVLAAGITLSTVTFSVVDAVLLKPLPVDHPEQLVSISTRDQDRTQRITPAAFWTLRDSLGSVDSIAALTILNGTMVTAGGDTGELPVTYATADMFRVLRLSPTIGRFWTDDEARENTAVAVLGYRFWRERFRSDPSVLGSTVSISDRTYTVIGVLSAASDHPETDLVSAPLWVPKVVPRSPSTGYFGFIIARMRPGASAAQVADGVRRLTGPPEWQPAVAPLLETYVASTRRWMLLALGAAILVVLAACANAANLMLSRALARAQEMAIRASLGASRRQIGMGVLVEGILLSLAAGACALLLSMAGVGMARAAVMTGLPYLFRASAIALNTRVLAAAIACAAATGILCSLVPAWQTSRVQVSTLLKDSEAPTATGRRRWRSGLLTAQVATVTVLLVVSWLFVVSLVRVAGVDLGVDTDNLLAVSPRVKFEATVDEVSRRIQRVPGVSDVAVSTGASLPLVGRAFGGAWITTTVRHGGGLPGSGDGSSIEVLEYRVTANYFAVAGLRFRRGGTWSSEAERQAPVVIDEQAARRLFGDKDPIGRQVRADEPAGIFTIVGTVPYVYARGAEEPTPPAAYFPLAPNANRTFAALFVRTSRPSADMLPVLTQALRPVGPRLDEPSVFAASAAVRRITAARRFNAGLMSIFGLMGALIGAAGMYAVMASFVAQQTREIGVRIALGATPARIQGAVLGLAGRHLLVGLALGVPAAWWLSGGFTALLFQVTPGEASVYSGVAALLVAVGLPAAWIPARRAARVDPIVSFRR